METVLPSPKRFNRLQIAVVIGTIFGASLFTYFVYQTGWREIFAGVSKIGWGFLLLIALYAVRLSTRATAWRASLEKPFKLNFPDAFRAVVIGEALSSLIPLGVLVSGTAKAVVVSRKIPFWVALASVATENLFYSLATSIVIILGAIAFILSFNLPFEWQMAGYVVVAVSILTILFGVFAIVRQWKFLSRTAEIIFQTGFLPNFLAVRRARISEFENQIFGFYRRQPHRFFPLLLLELAFHTCGVLEVLLILNFVSEYAPTLFSAFLLETINRVIIIVFKLVPLGLGVDEAGAQFITETLGIGAGLGVIIAIVRKANRLSWAIFGIILMSRSGLQLRELFRKNHEVKKVSGE